MPARAVRLGGAHTARDVGCHVEDNGFRGHFVSRPRTGFEVTNPAMPPSRDRSRDVSEGATAMHMPLLVIGVARGCDVA